MRYLPVFLLLAACAAAPRTYSPDLIATLASPEFEGRGVGTKGLERARDLLERELKRAGFAPGFREKTRDGNTSLAFQQGFRVFIGNELRSGNAFSGSKLEDFMPLAFSKSGTVKSAPVVFVGFGISVRQQGGVIYDDYDGVDAKGKIVVALHGDPATGNKESKFRNPAYGHYSSPMYKVQNAEHHGAAAVVLVRDPLSLSGKIEPPLRFQSRQGGGSTSAILAGQATIGFASRLLGKDLRKLQEEIARGQRPRSFANGRNASLKIAMDRQLGATENVAGLILGTDPKLANEYLVIGAHYDHLGFGGDSSMDPEGTGKVHAGADDNASGVQAVLDLARRIRAEGGLRRPVLVTFFSAEEVGLLGSKQFLESLPLPEGARVAAMVNLDMVGRLANDKLSVLAVRSGREFGTIVDAAAKGRRFDLVKGDSGFGSSDHASFLQAKVPALFFTTGAHADYHRPTDTAEKINREGMWRIEDFVHAVLLGIDALPEPPVYDPKSEDLPAPARGGRGYGVFFGSVPEFEQVEGQEGVRLQGVRTGSPAEQAGLKSGDLLTGLGEIKIKNLHDLVFALRFYRANEEVDVTWMRQGRPLSGKSVLRSREDHH